MNRSGGVKPNIKVDISLCGDIPRDELNERYGLPQPKPQLSTARLSTTMPSVALRPVDNLPKNSTECLSLSEARKTSIESGHYQVVTPDWAVPVTFEARLEPVCGAAVRQSGVDLTSKRAFFVGRSLACDVNLFHATSSRRHAIVCHHSSGSCYVVDCGSAHGTFLNGRRIPAPGPFGKVVPQRVRRGSLIRFGGVGAPSFVYKSFSQSLVEIEDMEVRNNTRLNALGCQSSVEALSVSSSKRARDGYDSESLCLPPPKRGRCASPPLSPELPLHLVSPDLPSKQRRVTFSMEVHSFFPVPISPEESEDET